MSTRTTSAMELPFPRQTDIELQQFSGESHALSDAAKRDADITWNRFCRTAILFWLYRNRANLYALAFIIGFVCIFAGVFEGTDATVRDMSFLTSAYYCVVTLTTIGYGDIRLATGLGIGLWFPFVIIGTIVMSFVLNWFSYLWTTVVNGILRIITLDRMRAATPPIATLLSFLLLFVIGIISALFLYLLEPDWDFPTALYFILITATTIGYGDVVPTSDSSRLFVMFYAVAVVSLDVCLIRSLSRLLALSSQRHVSALAARVELIKAGLTAASSTDVTDRDPSYRYIVSQEDATSADDISQPPSSAQPLPLITPPQTNTTTDAPLVLLSAPPPPPQQQQQQQQQTTRPVTVPAPEGQWATPTNITTSVGGGGSGSAATVHPIPAHEPTAQTGQPSQTRSTLVPTRRQASAEAQRASENETLVTLPGAVAGSVVLEPPLPQPTRRTAAVRLRASVSVLLASKDLMLALSELSLSESATQSSTAAMLSARPSAGVANVLRRQLQRIRERSRLQVLGDWLRYQIKIHVHVVISVGATVALVSVGAAVLSQLEGWSFLDALYFATVTFLTIGYGDVVPHTAAGRTTLVVVVVLGTAVVAYLLSVLGGALVEVADDRLPLRRAPIAEQETRCQLRLHRFMHRNRRLLISVAALTVYTLLGAVLFWQLQDIPFFLALYFTLQTLAMIGYGDILASTYAARITLIIYAPIGIMLMAVVLSLAADRYYSYGTADATTQDTVPE